MVYSIVKWVTSSAVPSSFPRTIYCLTDIISCVVYSCMFGDVVTLFLFGFSGHGQMQHPPIIMSVWQG